MSVSTTNDNKIKEYEHAIDPRIKAFFAIIVGMVGTIVIAWILGSPNALGPLMHQLQTDPKIDFLYNLIPFFFSFLLFGVLVYKAYVKEIKGLQFIGSTVLLQGIAELFYSLSPQPHGSIFRRTSLLASIADLLFPAAVVLLYLHIELTEKRRPNLLHAVGIIGTAVPLIIIGGLLIILKFFLHFDTLSNEVFNVTIIYLSIFALVVLWIALFGLKVMYNTLKHADSADIAGASLFVLIGFSSLLTNFLLLGTNYSYAILEKPLILNGANFTIHNTWLLTFALITVLIAYVIIPEFAYAIPFDVYQLLVINNIEGVTLFSHVNELRQDGVQTHDALQSPAIVAIQSLIKEIAYAEGHVVLIGMDDRYIILKTVNEVVSVLITQHNSYFINRGLEEFTKAFFDNFHEDIKKFNGKIDVFKSAKTLVNKHLPFMRKESLI